MATQTRLVDLLVPCPGQWPVECSAAHQTPGGLAMCYTCGCKLPYEDHGDPRNVIEQVFIDGGRTKEVKNAGRVAAKNNMLDLLQEEQRRGELDEPRQSYAEEAADLKPKKS